MQVLTLLASLGAIYSSTSYIWEEVRDPYWKYQLLPPIATTSKMFSRYFLGNPSSSGRSRRGPGMARASNVVFVLDSSSSIGRRQFLHELKAVHTIIKRSREDNKYAVVVFSSDAFIKLNFTDKWTALKHVIHFPYIPGKTNIQKGLSLAKQLFLDKKSNISKKNQNKVLLITDGLSNVKRHWTLYRGFELKMMGAQIYVIASGRFMYGAPETVGLASTPSRHFYRLYNMKAFLKATRMMPEIPFLKGHKSHSRSNGKIQ